MPFADTDCHIRQRQGDDIASFTIELQAEQPAVVTNSSLNAAH